MTGGCAGRRIRGPSGPLRSSKSGKHRAPRSSVTRVAWRLMRNEPVAYATSWIGWITFFSMPLLSGLIVKVVLDRIVDPDAAAPWGLLGALVGLEAVRWALLVTVAVQWHGCWVGWQTVQRVNVLSSLVDDPGPAAGRLPGAPGEAVSRFRDDVEDVSMVLDVWLDLSASIVTSAVALTVLLAIDSRVAVAVVIPTLVAMAACSWLGPRLRVWRRQAREAAARVTGFIGDVFGAVLAVQAAGAEASVGRRFGRINAARARVSLRDQVGSEVVRSLGYGTGEVAAGVALVVVASQFGRGGLSIGDLGLFAAYASVIADLPKWVGRYLVLSRQADVSLDRLAALLAEPERRAVAAPARTYLRHGPPPLAAPAVRAPTDGDGEGGALRELRADSLTVAHPGSGRGIDGVDLVIRRGELVVVTGPVGAGKTTLLRALLGLVGTHGGTVVWNGEPVADPSRVLVPPRAAYLPQVPRLFSEPLADTILLGEEPGELDDALRMVCLDEDLGRMPDGHATVIGPKGLRLSGGQIQRAGAARALVRRPDLLVVDDLSSALDADTEAKVWERVAGGGFETALLVSHRAHVLDRADRIVVLDAGRVVDVLTRA
jgi:ATP-binding cassette, subfamily B, bacterial